MIEDKGKRIRREGGGRGDRGDRGERGDRPEGERRGGRGTGRPFRERKEEPVAEKPVETAA
jgi:hypothetical protein